MRPEGRQVYGQCEPESGKGTDEEMGPCEKRYIDVSIEEVVEGNLQPSLQWKGVS